MKINVLTNRYDNSRSGVNRSETALTTESVSPRTFGKIFARTVDGDLYAQPLIVSQLSIGGKKRDVVYLATSRNWVYAYDAETPDEILPLWSRNLGVPVPRDEIVPGYLNFSGEIGITSTPVIDLHEKGSGTIFVVAKTRTIEAGNKTIRYEIHALNILTGRDRRASSKPVIIMASATNENGSKLAFDAKMQLNRPGLLLHNKVLYIAFGSHADAGPFYGWIMAYDSRTLTQLAVYNAAPDWGQGGIWQSGTGLACDAEGFVYAVVGNGEAPRENLKKKPPIRRPAKVESPVYGNAILKLRLDRKKHHLKVVDWFTASNTFDLNEHDEAPPAGRSSGHLIIAGGKAGKDGNFYLADRHNLGKWTSGKNPNVLQIDQLCTYHIHGAPVVWQKSDTDIVAYAWSEKDYLKAFAFKGDQFDGSKLPSTSVYGFPQDELRMPGGILAVSSDGTKDGTGIVWASHPTDDDAMNKTVLGTLRAYDARDLNKELWTSDLDARGKDRVGSLAKFCPPVVANGKVYMATFSRELVVYGLLGKSPRSNNIGVFELQGIGEGVQESGSYSCSRYELKISGQGISDKADHFLFARLERDSENESEIAISARVDGISAMQYPNARAGLMIRKFDQTSDPVIQRFAAMVITKSNKALFLHRDVQVGNVEQDGPIDVTLPCFIRLVATKEAGRAGFIDFSGEFSLDGNKWTTVSATTKIAIDGRLLVGLAVTAETGPIVEAPGFPAHATFSKVDVVPGLSDVTVG